MNMQTANTVLYVIAILICSFCCNRPNGGPFCPSPPLSEDIAIFAGIYGNEPGYWIFDANSLKRIDTFTPPNASGFLTFSSDYSEWYMITGSGISREVIAVNASSKQIIRQAMIEGFKLNLHEYSDLLVTYGWRETQFRTRNSFSLVHSDSIGYTVEVVASSPDIPMIYAAYSSIIEQQQGFGGLIVYNTDTFSIEHTFNVEEDTLQQAMMWPCDMATSINGEYLFLTTFLGSLYPDFWKGKFFVIDLRNLEVVAEFPCGACSGICVSSDGRYVYISDPAGGPISEIWPTNKILRYNVYEQSMEEFIDGPNDIGLSGSELITSTVLIAPDNRTMFVSLLGDTKTLEGEIVHMIKIDTHTKTVCATYTLPRDNQGHFTDGIAGIKLGRYSLTDFATQERNFKYQRKILKKPQGGNEDRRAAR